MIIIKNDIAKRINEMDELELTTKEINFLKSINNGFCNHKNLILYCDDCFPEYQRIQVKKWNIKELKIKKAYENLNHFENLYHAFCE
jgi:hypothetical protein